MHCGSQSKASLGPFEFPLDGNVALRHYGGMTLPEYLAKEQLNESAFARLLGVPNSTVHRWIKGKRHPSMALLPKIEQVTGGTVKAKDFYPAREAAE